MRKLIFIGFLGLLAGMTSCSKASDPTKDCIHCQGCFSDWDECSDTYRPTTENPMTWEEHRDYMVNNPSGATWYCERSH